MKLIKLLSDHYIIVDESEIKDVRPYIDMYHLEEGTTINKFPTYLTDLSSCKLITHSTQPLEPVNGLTNELNAKGFLFIKRLSLSEVKELLGEVDVRKKSDEYSKYETPDLDNDYLIGVSEGQIDGYTAGYNQALEDNKERKYTEKDVIAIVEKSRATGLTAEYIIQSLQPPTSWDVEFINGKLKLV